MLATYLVALWNANKCSYVHLIKPIHEKFGIYLNRNQIAGVIQRARERGDKVRWVGRPKMLKNNQKKPRSAPKRMVMGPDMVGPAAPPKKRLDFIPKGKEPAKKRNKRAGSYTLEEVIAINGCRYPYGHTPDMTFCGEPRKTRSNGVKSSYCEEHYDLCVRAEGFIEI